MTAAACSSGGNTFFGDAGADGGSTSVIATGSDGGKTTKKKDGGSTDDGTDDTTDVGTDSGIKKKDASVGFDANTTTCAPGDVSTFSPQWHPPAAHSTVCSAQQVTDILTCIFDGNANQTFCDSVNNNTANQPCANCLLTPDTAPSYGPIVITGQIGSLNTAGCIAVKTGNTTSSGCGAKYAAARQCADAACSDNCPGSDSVALQELQQCETDALGGDCSTYASAADSCATPLLAPDGGAAACSLGSTFLDAAINMGKIFCSP